MVHGAVRSFFQLLGALVLGLLIAVSFGVWRLSQGPVELAFLTPYIEQAISARDGSVNIRLDTTVLIWSPEDRLMELRARNVRAIAADTIIASIPELSLTLSGRALLKGELAPRVVRLFDPEIRLVRLEDGSIDWGLGDVADADDAAIGDAREAVQVFLGRVLEPVPGSLAADLREVDIVGANLELEDRTTGLAWSANEITIIATRDGKDVSLVTQINLDRGGETATFDAKAVFSAGSDKVLLSATAAQLRPASFAELNEIFQPLAALDMPLAGTFSSELTLDGRLGDVSFDISGKAGHVRAPPPVDISYPVAAVSLRGHVAKGVDSIVIEEFFLDLEGPTLTASARLDKGTAVGPEAHSKLKADAVLKDIPVETLKQFWPASAAPNPREWIFANISNGRVREASITLAGLLPDGNFDSFKVEHLSGEVHPEGLEVRYLHPMPPAENVSGRAIFDAQSFVLTDVSGKVRGLQASAGRIAFTGLDEIDQFAKIDLDIQGSVTEALTLLDSQPLGYAGKLGIVPSDAKGKARTKLSLGFPLLKDLALDDLKVGAQASLSELSLPDVFMGKPISHGTLDLNVTMKGMDASGNIVLGDVPVRLDWRENFASGQGFRSRYRLVGAINEAQRKSLRLTGPPFVAPYVDGIVWADVTATLQSGGTGKVEAKLDLSPAAMALPGMNWDKPEGAAASAEISLTVDSEGVTALPRFVVESQGLDVMGSVLFVDGYPSRVDFSKAVFGRTDASGSLNLGDSLSVNVTGPSFDASGLLKNDRPIGPGQTAPPKQVRKKDDILPPMTIAATVNQLWIGETGSLKNATASLRRDDKDWQSITISAKAGQGDMRFTLDRDGPQARKFLLEADDAGAVLREFEIFDNLMAGTLTMKGRIDDSVPDQPINGYAEVYDYHIVKAPALARLLTVAALTGIVDLLEGKGVGFAKLEAPFTLRDGLLELQDARAFGSALGITARGQIDLDADNIALEGTIVPAYAINSILGNIPLIGMIFSGDKGSGLFAATYSMQGSAQNPDVSVNPLAALTPGFLRKMFDVFDGDSTNARPLQARE